MTTTHPAGCKHWTHSPALDALTEPQENTMTTLTPTPFMGTEIPHWANDVAQHVIDEGHAEATVLHTSQAHERVLFRLPDGTVYIANRGRGLTTLTPTEATEMALFLLGTSNVREDGTEWGTREPKVKPEHVPMVTALGCSHASEDDAYNRAERYDDRHPDALAPAEVLRRERYTVVTPWEAI